MDITILNGSPQTSSLDDYLQELSAQLQLAGHQLTLINLREIALRHCIGCWGCWVKTPGQCSSGDASLAIDRAVINSDFVLWAAPLRMGFPSELLKMANDKHLPLIHPYMVVDLGEAHHMRRYPRSPRVGLLLEKEEDTDLQDLQIVTDIYCRTAINFKTRLSFSLTTDTPPTQVVKEIERSSKLPIPKRLSPTSGIAIVPPKRLTLFNGSPRGRRGNTPIMLGEISKGFNGDSEIYHLVRMKETDKMVQAFADAECVVLGFPLYTDSMPGVTKHFIEALRPLVGKANPPIVFLVQSGFPEGLHSRFIERYLEKLADRLGSPYLGTVVKGNGESTRVMPPQMTQSLFKNLQALGHNLSNEGKLDSEILREIAKPEKFPTFLDPVFRLFVRLPVAHSYFDNMLKENGSYDQRFARPFVN